MVLFIECLLHLENDNISEITNTESGREKERERMRDIDNTMEELIEKNW